MISSSTLMALAIALKVSDHIIPESPATCNLDDKPFAVPDRPEAGF